MFNTVLLVKHECCSFTLSTALEVIAASKCNLQVMSTPRKVNFFITYDSLFYYYFITSTKKIHFLHFCPKNAVGGLQVFSSIFLDSVSIYLCC